MGIDRRASVEDFSRGAHVPERGRLRAATARHAVGTCEEQPTDRSVRALDIATGRLEQIYP